MEVLYILIWRRLEKKEDMRIEKDDQEISFVQVKLEMVKIMTITSNIY